ncbi:MAG TPA: DUF2971 domain-containing protein [Saprospiraceae bacterium]|nr:DUF2971 domain-containing protein [Saprospiraceae bacterium]
MLLYKYRVWNQGAYLPIAEQFQRKILTERQIFLASPSSFNDPYDIAIPRHFKKEEMTRDNLFKKLYNTFQGNISDDEKIKLCNERIDSGVFENGQYVVESHPLIKDAYAKKTGVFCLSSKNDDILMWAHYADLHKGFCLGFLILKHCIT